MTTPDRQIWTDMLAHLQSHHPDLCRHWFEELDPILFDAGTLSIRAQSEVHRDYLRRHTLDAFNDAIRTVTGQLVSVRFLGPQDPVPEAAPQSKGTPGRTHAGASSKAGSKSRSNAKTPAGTNASAQHDATHHATHHASMTNSAGTPEAAAGHHASSQQAAHTGSATPPNPGNPATNPGTNPGTNKAAQRATQLHASSNHRADHPADHADNRPVGHARTDAHAPGLDPMIEPKPRRSAHNNAGGSEAALADHPDALNINPDHNFENFVIGPANRVATAAAQAVGDKPGDAYNPLFIHGGVGLGKTHLLQSICLRVLQHSPSAVIYYLSCEAFVTQFVDAIRAGEMSDFRHRYRDVDVLVIDDIHFLTGHDRTQEEFFHTFNSLYQARKQIVLSSDAAPEEIPDLEERLVSRFKWGLVAEMKTPDFETRTAIVQTKAKLRGLTFPTDVAAFIAERVHRNVRELEGAITTIQIRAQIDKREINLDLAREAMGEAPVPVIVQPTLGQITDAVTRYYNVKVTDLQSRRRHKSVSLPRQVCMYIARKKTRYSLEEIGGFYGGRDHTTVMHAVKTITERSNTETDLVAAISNIEQGLG